jgi:hypothetical protein
MTASAPPSPPLADATAALDAAVARLEDAARQARDNAAQAVATAAPVPDPARAALLSEATDRLDALMLRLNAALAQPE